MATEYDDCILNISANLPWSGGIIAPPKIIIIRNVDPWEVYLPRPVMLSVNMQGHIIEQNNPPDNNAYRANSPEANTPIPIPRIPNKLNIFKVLVGLSLARKNPQIWIAIQKAKRIISNTEYFPKLTNKITPKAM